MAAFNGVINLAGIEALEEAEILARGRRRHHRQIVDPMEDLSDNEFVKTYRLTKPLVNEVVNLVEPHMDAPKSSSGLTVEHKILIALRFFASGSYQMDIGRNINHAVSQSAVSKSIAEVSDALNDPQILNFHVKLPRNVEELQHLCNSFFQKHQFPGVIGCVDCTHVAIFPPESDDPIYPEAIYVNRKGYHSINVQLICDHNLKIMNVCARYPGSTHDMFVWNNSSAFHYMHNLHLNGHRTFYLLVIGFNLYLSYSIIAGDSGYALRPWMLTPLADAEEGTPEGMYNESQKSTRSIIERCNGVLKLRFRCLLKHRVLHYKPNRCSKIINSCVVLHNMCVENNLPPVNFGDEDEDRFIEMDYGQYNVQNIDVEAVQGGRRRINPELEEGRNLQQYLLRNHFNL